MTETITEEQWAKEFIAEFERLNVGHAELAEPRYSPGRYPVTIPAAAGGVTAQDIMQAYDGALMVCCSLPGATAIALVPVPQLMDGMLTEKAARAWARAHAGTLVESSEKTLRETMAKMNVSRDEAERMWR